MKTRSPLRPLFAALFAALLVAAVVGCRAGGTLAIKALLDDPTHYDHQRVRIHGHVTRAVGLMGYGAYQVDDGSGTISVVSQGGGAPRDGAEVGVEGEFRSAFTLGTTTVAVIMESKRVTR